MTAPPLRVRAIELFERDVTLRLPFRFGAATLTAAPQLFLRATIESGGRTGQGAAAELLAPKWFDKDPALSNEQNFDQLRTAVRIAAERYLAAGPGTAYGLSAACQAPVPPDMPKLVWQFGPALIDRAVLDALCRLHGPSFAAALRAGLSGFDPASPELAGFDTVRFLAGLATPSRIAARHTVGLVDAITEAEPRDDRADDGLPESLEGAIAAYGHRWFKLKVSGNVPADLDRLARIAAVLDTQAGEYRATLDGNEQFASAEAFAELWRRMGEAPGLARLRARVAFVEQPVARAAAFDHPLGALGREIPVEIDESDDEPDAFPRARALGYAGVSSKACKGFYKSLLNAARCAHWNAVGEQRLFMSGEDLTTQAGLAVQQDLAIVAALGLSHVERNGHHFGSGFAPAPEAEQQAFLAAHPGLYRTHRGAVRLAISGGMIELGWLDQPGFAAAAMPDWNAMRRVPDSIPSNHTGESPWQSAASAS